MGDWCDCAPKSKGNEQQEGMEINTISDKRATSNKQKQKAVLGGSFA
jgi:hypothetical protein